MNIKIKILSSFGILVVFFCVTALIVTLLSLSAINTLHGIPEFLESEQSNEATDTLVVMLTVTCICAGCAFAVSAVLILYLSRNISKPLGFLAEAISGIAVSGNIFLDDKAYKLTKTLNKRADEIGKISRSVGDMLAMFRTKIHSLNAVAKGDLTTGIVLRSDNDTIGKALSGMVSSLNDMFSEIHSASGLVSAGSHQLADGAEMLADGSVEQAEVISQLSENVATIAAQTKYNAEMAREAANLSGTIKSLAQKGGTQMENLIDAVNQINLASDAISRVIKAIDEIAFQTSILALNASVEAARAGHAGFAVVASEVRNLANRSQTAAGETGELITDSITKAKLGSAIAEETAASLSEIVNGINRSASLIEDIARSSDEQADAITRINASVDQVNRVVHQNSETATHSARASKEVSGQSELLQDLIGQFKIKEALPGRGDR